MTQKPGTLQEDPGPEPESATLEVASLRAPIRGELRLPGDKSLSHRALLFAALAQGESVIGGLGKGADVASTRSALAQLGVQIRDLGDTQVSVLGKGLGSFLAPAGPVECGNSGTTSRLLAGAAMGSEISLVLTGDRSLRARPMARVVRPLREMGCEIIPEPVQAVTHPQGPVEASVLTLPLRLRGPALRAIHWHTEVASAQVKSCVLLAGLGLREGTELREPWPSRDHTERMLEALGVAIEYGPAWVRLAGNTGSGEAYAGQGLRVGGPRSFEFEVPGDPSSAAFLVVAAALREGSKLRLGGLGLNPGRIAYLKLLQRMGAALSWRVSEHRIGEPVGDLEVTGGALLRGVEVEASELPGIIDEVPILAVAAAFATGWTVFRGAAELRHKESDRLLGVQRLLQSVGVRCEVEGETLRVEGKGCAPTQQGDVDPQGDHRMALAGTVLLSCSAGGRVHDAGCMGVSYAELPAQLASLSAQGSSSG